MPDNSLASSKGELGAVRTVRSDLAIAAAIFVLALTIRVAFVMYVPVGTLAGGDGPALERTAITILNGQIANSGEGTAIRMPGFPFLLAQVYRFGVNHDRVFLVQALLGSLTVVVFYFLIRRISFAVAVIASLVLVFHPMMLLFTKQVLTEPLHTFFLVSIVFLALLTVENKWWAIALGIAWGCLVLTRSEALVTVLPLIAGVGLLAKQNRRFRVVVPVLLMLLVISPWVIRNYRLFGYPTLQTALGWNLYVSFNPAATGSCDEPEPLSAAPQNEGEKNVFYRRQALQFIIDNPGAALFLSVKKQSYLWRAMNNQISDLGDLLLVPFVVAGVIIGVKKREAVLLLGPIIGVTSVFLVFQAVPRYRAPMYPFFIAFASLALVSAARRIASHMRTSVLIDARDTSTVS